MSKAIFKTPSADDGFTFTLMNVKEVADFNELTTPVFKLKRDLLGGANVSVKMGDELVSLYLHTGEYERLAELIETTLVGPIGDQTKLDIYKAIQPRTLELTVSIFVGKDEWKRIWVAVVSGTKATNKFYLTAGDWYNYIVPIRRISGLK